MELRRDSSSWSGNGSDPDATSLHDAEGVGDGGTLSKTRMPRDNLHGSQEFLTVRPMALSPAHRQAPNEWQENPGPGRK
jgi:hypothetical protein